MTSEGTSRARWYVTAVLAMVALLAAACGAGARDGSPVTVEAISASTSSGGSARMAMTMTMAFPQMGEMRVSMEGVTTLHSDVEQVRAAFTMAMDPTSFSPAMEGELRLVDGRMFARGDLVKTMGFSGTTGGWLELEGAQRDAFLNFGTAPNPADPTMALDALLAVEGLEAVGREELRGADTRRFSATTTNAALLDAQGVDLEQALADQQVGMGQQPQHTPDELLEAVRELPVELDIWIDDQDRLRRSRLQVDMSPMWQELLPEGERPGPGEATMVTDVEFYDYGTPVDVEVPEAAAFVHDGELATSMVLRVPFAGHSITGEVSGRPV